MFSAIPLPQVVPNTPVGGNVLGGMQAAQNYSQTALQNQFYPQLARAQVQQQQAQAAAAPLNAMATIASNPMIWALMSPQQRQQMSNYMANSVLNTQQALLNQQSNQQGNQQNSSPSFMGRIMNAFVGGAQPQQNQNSMAPNAPSGNALVSSSYSGTSNNAQAAPSGNAMTSPTPNTSQNYSGNASPNLPSTDVGSGIGSKAVAPYAEQLHAGGTLYVDSNGNPTSVASPGNVQQYQYALDSVNRALPFIDDLQKESKEFLGPGTKAKLAKAEAASVAEGFNLITPEMAKRFNIDTGLVGRYNQFVANQNLVKEALKNSFVFPNTMEGINQISSVATPTLLTENYPDYVKRLNDLKDNLNNRIIPGLKKSLRVGYNVSGNEPDQNSNQNNSPVPGGNGLLQIKDSNGSIHTIFAKNLSEALRRDPDATVMGR